MKKGLEKLILPCLILCMYVLVDVDSKIYFYSGLSFSLNSDGCCSVLYLYGTSGLIKWFLIIKFLKLSGGKCSWQMNLFQLKVIY